MARRDLPTASVRDPRGSTDDGEPTRTKPSGAFDRSDRDRIEALEREVQTLRAELERRDERLQTVVDRYEAILDRQRRDYERRLRDDTDHRSSSLRARLTTLFRRG